MKRLTQLIILVLFFLPITYHLQPMTYAYAAVPHLINYQGRLTDSSGTPLNGSYQVTFRIYDAETAGNLLWEETHSGVVIQKGIFSILLGSVTNLDLAFDKQYYLEIKVGSEVMSPRQRITSAGYAIRAEAAEEAEKVKASSTDTAAGYLDSKVKNSVVVENNQMQLSGDTASPGINKIYGTNNSGVKGWQSPIGIPVGMQVFTSSGMWLKPSGVTKVWVKAWGGGGGGMGNPFNPPSTGGGGSGAYAEGIVSVSGDVPITIGAGGTNGKDGSQSSFGTSVVAGGGKAGSSSGGGEGGIASLGDIRINGNGGHYVNGGGAPFGGNGGVGSRDYLGGNGSFPGGGGGAGKESAGDGANGMVIVYW